MTTDAVGGVWVYSTALARKLCELGCQVSLVTLGPEPRKDQLLDVRGVRGLDLTVTDLALEWTDPDGRDLSRALEQLISIEQAVKPDVIHLNGYREALGEWKAPVLVVAHSCVCSWWRSCRGGSPSEPAWSTYAANTGAGLRAADQWVAPTAAFRDTIQELYDPPTIGHVIRNGVDSSVRPARKEPIILAAGRLWDEAKGVANLVGAAERVPWPIRLAGPLASIWKPTGCGSTAVGLQPLGELSRRDLMREMRRSSIFVAPAVYEPFGLTVLEAALAGCALVLSDITSFRELWDGAALFSNPRDPDMLHSVLAHLTRNDALRRDLQQRAVRRARRYSVSAMIDGYRRLYERMGKSHQSRAASPRILAEAH